MITSSFNVSWKRLDIRILKTIYINYINYINQKMHI